MKHIDTKLTYIVNHAYKFRCDKDNVIVTNNDSLFFDSNDPDSSLFAETGFAWKSTPLIAYLFSFFNGKYSFQETLEIISSEMNVSTEELEKAINPFVENEEKMIFNLSETNQIIVLPKYFLIIKNKKHKIRDVLNQINFETIKKSINTQRIRLNIPNETCIMLNTECLTDCIYCYADKKKIKNKITHDRIIELIKEARSLNMRDFAVSGGDFFLYKEWEDLIKNLLTNNYRPYISTKIPIGEEEIGKLKNLGIDCIQISLDTIDIKVAKKMLCVNNDYIEKMTNTLTLLDNAGILFNIKSVITKHNDDISSVMSLVNFLFGFKNCKRVTIAPGEFSFYKKFNYKTTPEKILKIKECISEYKKEHPGNNISVQDISSNPFSIKDIDEKIKNFNERGVCSGNTSQFYILPDGKVTICEQMYWHPNFILGDLSYQSITEMWNSKEALGLYNRNQFEFSSKSACKTCNQFEECRRGFGVCWRNAVFAYGQDKFDYPSPDCPYAPLPINNIFI
jgi:radical SAM protein with 4Fe4S-binding SPASM domain